MKSRFLSRGEQRDVEQAALSALRMQHPGSVIAVTVLEETDERGVPRYTYTIKQPEDGNAKGS